MWFANSLFAGDIVQASEIGWATEWGITGVMIAMLSVALRRVYSDRISDHKEIVDAKNAQISAAIANSEIHLATAEKLIAATNRQTEVLQKFSEELGQISKQVKQCTRA